MTQFTNNSEDNKTVPFYCPLCNGERAILLDEVIMATPYDATLQCEQCKQAWRIELFPVEIEEE